MPSKIINYSKNKNKNKKQKQRQRKRQQSKQSEEMSLYQRKEVIDTIVQFLSKNNCNIEHLILGHNDFTFNECQTIIYAASQYGGLITLDLYGNHLTDEELYHVDKLLYTVRKAKLLRLLLDKDNKSNKILLPNSIALIICDFVMNKKDPLYRCHKWKPFKIINNKTNKNYGRANDHPSVTYKRRSL